MPNLTSAVLTITMLSSGVLSVNLVGESAAMLSWEAPTHRENGELLTSKQIGGYSIKYGLQSDLKTMTINDPGTHHVKIYDLPWGENVFTISAFDQKGLHGEFSEPVYKTIVSDRDAP